MDKTYTDLVATTYLCNVFRHTKNCKSEAARNIVDWIDDTAKWSFSWVPEDYEASREITGKDRKRLRKNWKHLLSVLRSLRSELDDAKPDTAAMQVRRLAQHLNLTRDDMAIVELLLRYKTDPVIESLLDNVFNHLPRLGSSFRYIISINNPVVPQMLGMSAPRFSQRLASDSALIRSGIIRIDSDGELILLDQIMGLAFMPFDPNEDVRELFFNIAPKAGLEWQDYDHVACARDHVERLIRGALQARATGVNVLLYGPHGTGKTEFCRALAERLGVPMYSVGEGDHSNAGRERLRELLLAQRLLGDHGNSILLFDEMDDILSDPQNEWNEWASGLFASAKPKRGALESKLGMNRLLEEVRMPVLWTTNSPWDVSPAILRRMMFAFEMRQPSTNVRARVWARQLDKHGISSSQDDADALARSFDVTPGVAAGATAAASLIEGGDMETVRFGVQSLSNVVYGQKPPQEAGEKIDPALISADTDASKLAERLAKRGSGRMSICLHGPPGTGKSAFVRHLGERMGIEVVQKRASDLISMWVGQSEANIARAFEEARENGHFLVFDEADSLLSDRRHAQRNYEVSQVNEMLTWMEHHPLPFACTTNFVDRLDPATLRRFDFKMGLDYLSARQAEMAFRSFFELEPPGRIGTLHNLTPGDFALVHRKAEVLGALGDRDALFGMLRDECEAKPGCRRQIGFAA